MTLFLLALALSVGDLPLARLSVQAPMPPAGQARPVEGRAAIGVFGGWGAFSDASPRRCYAIARPDRPRGSRGFAAVSDWPGQDVHNQFHVRLSRARHPRGRVMLSVGERRFELVAGDRDAWAPDVRTDRAIVAAMRSERSMSVETTAADGRAMVDVYALSGAATAIDAAALACVAR